MIFGFPIQLVLVIIILKQREKGVKITDKRVRLTTEVRLMSALPCVLKLTFDAGLARH